MKKNELSFFDINLNYIYYLKQFDNKVPDIEYASTNKFLCGIVLHKNDFSYFVPVSSYNKKQQTNFLIYDKDKAISSLRFSFMIPIKNILCKTLLKEIIINDINTKNRKLLYKEYIYINNNKQKIFEKAKKVYDNVVNNNLFFTKCCCNFKLLENKCLEFDEQKEYNKLYTDDLEL